MEESPRSGMSSPEAKVGMQVEDLWDIQEPQLSPSEKLNSCFENIPVSAFPRDPSSVAIEIKSDATLAEAVQILSENKLLSAPVVDVDAQEDASWIDRYIGIVEFAGIVVWILHQSEISAMRKRSQPIVTKPMITESEANNGIALAAAAAEVAYAVRKIDLGTETAAPTSGTFFESLTSSEFYRNTKVRDIAGSFRWAPFLALPKSDSFLTMLLLLSKYKMKSLPVVDLGERKIDNVITQSSVIHMLAECVGLHWFESWGTKKLCELGLPLMKPSHIVKVYEDEPVLQAFKLMRKRGIGGLPVIESGGTKAVGNISIRDIQFLLTTPDIYSEYRSITAKNFLTAVRNFLEEHEEASPMLTGMITCKRDDTVKEVILMLDSEKIHRIYVVDDDGNLEGVVTLRDIISKLVHEPRGYFGDFFDGVLPLPSNSRV